MKIYTVTKVGDKYDLDFFSEDIPMRLRMRPCNTAIAFVEAHPRFHWLHGEIVDAANLDVVIAHWEAAGYVKFKSGLLIRTMWDD